MWPDEPTTQISQISYKKVSVFFVIVIGIILCARLVFADTLQWDLHTDTTVKGYKIYLLNVDTNIEKKIIIPDRLITEYPLDINFAKYHITMTAYNDAGESIRSNMIGYQRESYDPGVSDVIESGGAVPEPPSGLEIIWEKIVAFFKSIFGRA